MKKVQILGTGCAKCQKLTENTKAAAQHLGIDIDLEKVTDIPQIMQFGIMSTPGLVIDGEVVSSGKLLRPEEIIPLLR
jgi:small redox-active disulfide protein 2